MSHQHPDEHREPALAGAAQRATDDEAPPSIDDPAGGGAPPGDDSKTGGGDDDGDGELDDVDVKDLLRVALEPPKGQEVRIAEGVHRKIYKASGGRYFADGWSTTPAPRATYLVTSVLMLLVIVLAWLLLSPWGL
jgi:hypothetical protein